MVLIMVSVMVLVVMMIVLPEVLIRVVVVVGINMVRIWVVVLYKGYMKKMRGLILRVVVVLQDMGVIICLLLLLDIAMLPISIIAYKGEPGDEQRHEPRHLLGLRPRGDRDLLLI